MWLLRVSNITFHECYLRVLIYTNLLGAQVEDRVRLADQWRLRGPAFNESPPQRAEQPGLLVPRVHRPERPPSRGADSRRDTTFAQCSYARRHIYASVYILELGCALYFFK